VLRLARNLSNRCGSPDQANREELRILWRAGGNDRHHRPTAGSRKLARSGDVRPERDARAGGTRTAILSAGNVRKIPQNTAFLAVDSRGADGGLRNFNWPGEESDDGTVDATGGHRGIRLFHWLRGLGRTKKKEETVMGTREELIQRSIAFLQEVRDM